MYVKHHESSGLAGGLTFGIVKLMNKFSIPYVAVYDCDHQAHKSSDAIASANISTQKIKNEINSDIGSSIVLMNDIEEELGLPNGGSNKPYIALNHITSESFNFSAEMIEKIKAIYDAGV